MDTSESVNGEGIGRLDFGISLWVILGTVILRSEMVLDKALEDLGEVT
jgi:hypothetical protein